MCNTFTQDKREEKKADEEFMPLSSYTTTINLRQRFLFLLYSNSLQAKRIVLWKYENKAGVFTWNTGECIKTYWTSKIAIHLVSWKSIWRRRLNYNTQQINFILSITYCKVIHHKKKSINFILLPHTIISLMIRKSSNFQGLEILHTAQQQAHMHQAYTMRWVFFNYHDEQYILTDHPYLLSKFSRVYNLVPYFSPLNTRIMTKIHIPFLWTNLQHTSLNYLHKTGVLQFTTEY